MTTKDVRRLAAESETDPRTVERIYRGEVSRPLVRGRVIEAAKKLKLPAPPEPETKQGE